VATDRSIVAIVGRQNVGKSALLNRAAGKRLAIVEDVPGTTRDRLFATVPWQETEFTLVDTGGLELDTDSTITAGVRYQVEAAINEAAVIIFLVDAQAGLTTLDAEIADMLRRTQKPVLLAANKADNARLETESLEFYELGLGEPLPVSAHHGRGIADLLDHVIDLLPHPAPVEASPQVLQIAIVGRPNVGKSMLLNTLVGDERAIVDDVPGTTHDAVDTVINYDGKDILLIDTAGIRRRGKVAAGIEKYSVMRALHAIERADVVLLVLDATEPLTAQDTHVAGYIQQAYKGIILIVNKWDLIDDKDTAAWDSQLRARLKSMTFAPILYTSAKYGKGIKEIIPQAQEIYEERRKRLSTSVVNSAVQQAAAVHNLPRKGKKQLKLFYATQAEVNPPTFVFFVNDSKLIHFSYQRYLENTLRQAFGFTGTPLRMIFKSRGEQ